MPRTWVSISLFKAGRCYHLVSRIAHRAFFFDEVEKNRFAELLMRVEYFSGVRIIGWCKDFAL